MNTIDDHKQQQNVNIDFAKKYENLLNNTRNERSHFNIQDKERLSNKKTNLLQRNSLNSNNLIQSKSDKNVQFIENKDKLNEYGFLKSLNESRQTQDDQYEGRKSHGPFSKRNMIDSFDNLPQKNQQSSQKRINFEDLDNHQYEKFYLKKNGSRYNFRSPIKQLKNNENLQSDKSCNQNNLRRFASQSSNNKSDNLKQFSPSKQIKIMFNQISQDNPFAIENQNSSTINQSKSEDTDTDIISIGKERVVNLEDKIHNIPYRERKIYQEHSYRLLGGIKRFSDQNEPLMTLKLRQELQRQNLLYSSPFNRMTEFQSIIIARDNSLGQNIHSRTPSKGRRGLAPTQGQIHSKSIKNSHLFQSIYNCEDTLLLNEQQINKMKNQKTNIDVFYPENQEISRESIFGQNINKNQKQREGSRSKSKASIEMNYEDAAGKKSEFMKSIEASISQMNFVKQNNYMERESRKQRSLKAHKFSQVSNDQTSYLNEESILPYCIHRDCQKIQKETFENLSDMDDENKKQVFQENKYDSRNYNSKHESLGSYQQAKINKQEFNQNQNQQKPDIESKPSTAAFNTTIISSKQMKNIQQNEERNQKLPVTALEEAVQIRFNQSFSSDIPIPAVLAKQQNQINSIQKPQKIQIQYQLQEPIYGRLSEQVLKDFSKQSIIQIQNNFGINQEKIQNFLNNPKLNSVFKQQQQQKQVLNFEEREIQNAALVIQRKIKGYLANKAEKQFAAFQLLANKLIQQNIKKINKELIICLKKSHQHLKLQKQALLNTFITYCAIKIQKVFRGKFSRKYIYKFRKSLKTLKNYKKLLAIQQGWKIRRIFNLKVVINKCLNIQDHNNINYTDGFEENLIKKSRQSLIKSFINFIQNLLNSDGQWLMLFMNENRNLKKYNYVIPQSKDDEIKALEQLKQRYQIARRTQSQKKPTQRVIRNEIQPIENKKQFVETVGFYSYKNDEKKQEQMNNFIKRMHYQPSIQAQKKDEQLQNRSSFGICPINGEIQYFENVVQVDQIQQRRSKTVRKVNFLINSQKNQNNSIQQSNSAIFDDPTIDVKSQQKEDDRWESSKKNKLIVRQENLQAKENLIKRNTYIPDLKKRFIVQIEQKIKEENNPQNFLKKYIERKQLRKSFPDAVNANKQLSVNKSVIQLHQNPKKIEQKQIFQRSCSSKLIENKKKLQKSNQNQKQLERLSTYHSIQSSSIIQNNYESTNFRKSQTVNSQSDQDSRSMIQSKNKDIIGEELIKYKERKQIRNTFKDRVDQNSQLSLKIQDIIKYSNHSRVSPLKTFTKADGPIDNKSNLFQTNQRNSNSLKNLYVSQKNDQNILQNSILMEQIIEEKDQNQEIKQQLLNQQQKLKNSQNETELMLQELIEKKYSFKSIKKNEIENQELKIDSNKIDNNSVKQIKHQQKNSFSFNQTENSSMKNPYINLSQSKKEQKSNKTDKIIKSDIEEVIKEEFQENSQAIKPYIKLSRQSIEQESPIKDLPALNSSIFQQLSPQLIQEDSQSFKLQVNQIYLKDNSEQQSTILNRTLQSEFKRENDDSSFAFKMEKMSGLQSFVKSENKGYNEDSFAYKMERLSGLQSLQNRSSIFNQSSNKRQDENDNDESFGFNLQQINNESKFTSTLNLTPLSYSPLNYFNQESPLIENISLNIYQNNDQFSSEPQINLQQNLNDDFNIELKQKANQEVIDEQKFFSNQTFNNNENEEELKNTHYKNDSEFTLGLESQREQEKKMNLTIEKSLNSFENINQYDKNNYQTNRIENIKEVVQDLEQEEKKYEIQDQSKSSQSILTIQMDGGEKTQTQTSQKSLIISQANYLLDDYQYIYSNQTQIKPFQHISKSQKTKMSDLKSNKQIDINNPYANQYIFTRQKVQDGSSSIHSSQDDQSNKYINIFDFQLHKSDDENLPDDQECNQNQVHTATPQKAHQNFQDSIFDNLINKNLSQKNIQKSLLNQDLENFQDKEILDSSQLRNSKKYFLQKQNLFIDSLLKNHYELDLINQNNIVIQNNNQSDFSAINNSKINEELNQYFQIFEKEDYQNSTQVNSQKTSSAQRLKINNNQGKSNQNIIINNLKQNKQKLQNIKNMQSKNESIKNVKDRIQMSNIHTEQKVRNLNVSNKVKLQHKKETIRSTKSAIDQYKKILQSQKELEQIFQQNKKIIRGDTQKNRNNQKEVKQQSLKQVDGRLSNISRNSYLNNQSFIDQKNTNLIKDSFTVDQTIQQIRMKIQERITKRNIIQESQNNLQRENSQDSNFKISVIQMKQTPS